VRAAAIRLLEPQDIPAVLQIQASSPEASPWAQSAYENIARSGEKCWVAERGGKLAGFLVARAAAGEMEILNLAVAREARQRGIGSALLQQAFGWGAGRGAERVFLELRASNAAAQRFYDAHGFRCRSIRRRYYRNPVEDALVLTTVLSENMIQGQPGVQARDR
jgi:[ribosomal protein S18]-alanine N-acetyltransferase